MDPRHITLSEIILSCVEEDFYKDDLILDQHGIVRILSGEMKVVQADRTTVFGAGDTLFLPRHQVCTVIKYPSGGNPYRSVSLIITTDRLREYFTHHAPVTGQRPGGGIKSYARHPLLDSFFASLLPYLELDGDLPESIRALKLEEGITVLRTLDPTIDRELTDFSTRGKIDLVPFMQQHYMHNLKTERFAQLTGRSLTTFKNDFKRAFLTTPQKWLTQKRLELAYRLIAEHRQRPSDAYLEAGFEDLSHFSFAFKKQYGFPPTQLVGR